MKRQTKFTPEQARLLESYSALAARYERAAAKCRSAFKRAEKLHKQVNRMERRMLACGLVDKWIAVVPELEPALKGGA